MWYVAKALQLIGLTGALMSLYWGLSMEHGMGRELSGLAISAVFFYLGRALESKIGKG